MILYYPGSPTNSYLFSTSFWPVPEVHLCTFAFSLILFLERASSLDLSFFTSYEQLSASYSHVDPPEVTTCKDKHLGLTWQSVAKTSCSQFKEPGFNPLSGNESPRTTTKTWHSQIN